MQEVREDRTQHSNLQRSEITNIGRKAVFVRAKERILVEVDHGFWAYVDAPEDGYMVETKEKSFFLPKSIILEND